MLPAERPCPQSANQSRSWEDEKAGLVAQIEALRREAKTRRGGKDGDEGGAAPGGASAKELDALRREMNEMREEKVRWFKA